MSLLPTIEDFLPFTGLPFPIQALFVCALFVSVVQIAAVLQLAWRSIQQERLVQAIHSAIPMHGEQEFLWVFIVPALNEEVTIDDTLNRLETIEATNKVFIVINDGSTDNTGKILEERASEVLVVMNRVLPKARVGKAAALNDAWAQLPSLVDPELLARFTPAHTLIVVVDADGRLDPTFAAGVAQRFANPIVGGVQLAVRIYNRTHPLAYMQDVEFRMFGSTFQLGRSYWGTAGMGGNGQTNRLSALDRIGEINILTGHSDGPWRHTLTEDQDLGISLIEQGWANRQEMRHTVEQQGLSNFPRLFKQRVRWCQGNMQAMVRWQALSNAPVPFLARVDALYWLLQPLVQALIGISLMCAVILLTIHPDYFSLHLHITPLIAFLLMAFGGTFIAVIRAQTVGGKKNILTGILLIFPYSLYCWTLLPIYFVAFYRQLRRKQDWVKTDREAITAPEPDSKSEKPLSK